MPDADLVVTMPGAAPAADGFVPHERYELQSRIGQGGMGSVWAAHDRVLDRPVALKVLHDEFLGSDDQARLVAEARAMARLSHRNVVDVYDVAEKDGRTYLAMELVRGIDLAAWLATKREPRAIAAVFRAAASGLAAAHAAGIVHRDVKPSNILVGDDGEVRVADFGVASAVDATTRGLVGTLAYMAPEQLRGEPADARSDQFALCASLYEALHGVRPFVGDDVPAQLALMANGCPPPVRDVPRWLHAATARGLAEDPAQRFRSMHELAAALSGPRRRREWLIALAVVVGGGAVATALLLGRDERAACPDPQSEMAGVWDASIAERGEATFATGAAYAPAAWTRIDRELDRYAQQWASAANIACHAGDARKRACLDERKALIGAIGARLAADPAIAARGAQLFHELPAHDDCTTERYLPAVSLRASASARADLATARAALVTGVASDDVATAARALAAARGDRALELAATLVHGRVMLAHGDVDAAIPQLERAAALASREHASALESDAEVALAEALIARGRLDDAAAALGRARSLPDMDPRRRARQFAIACDISHRRGDFAQAMTDAREALRQSKLARTDEQLWALPIHARLADATMRAGQPEEALAVSKRVVDLARQLGDKHPRYGRALVQGAVVQLALAHVDKARVKVTAGMRVARDAFGEQHLDVAAAHEVLARIAVAAHDDRTAVDELRAALAIRLALAPDTAPPTQAALDEILAGVD